MKVHWTPQPKQELALKQTADEVLYGGARGGGKTDAGQAWLLYHIDKPLYRALVIRRNADDLKDWIDRARRMYGGTGAEFTGTPAEITFPSGAKIRTGHLKDDSAYTKYQGHEYQNILLEELTHIPRAKDYEALLGSCRSTVEGIKPQIFATTNPDGPGYAWVKKRFAIPDRPTGPVYTEQDGRTLVFIPSSVEDNPALVDKDPGYIKYLESIQDVTLRRQWREGSWEQPKVEGAYYSAQMDAARDSDRITSVPYDSFAAVDTWWDIGIGDATAIWFSQTIGNEIHFIDYLESEGEGLQYYAKTLQALPYVYGTHNGPHDLAARELGTGVSRKETALKYGLDFTIVPRLSIDDGINAVRTILGVCWFDKDKCKQGLDALRNYKKLYDEKRAIYKNKPDHDWSSHGADAFRYFAMGYSKGRENMNMMAQQQYQVEQNRTRNRSMA